jgi:histidinol phosphatase-like enzyme
MAAETLSLDLSASILIGDALSDIEAGMSVGISKLILVRTGRGTVQASLKGMRDLGEEVTIYDTLADALDALLATKGHEGHE